MQKNNLVSIYAAQELLTLCLSLRKQNNRLASIEHKINASRNDFQGKIEEVDYLYLWEFALENIREDHFALALGGKISPESKGPLASYICSCRTLEEAIEEIVRLFSVMNPSEQWQYSIDGEIVVLEYSVINDKYPPQIADRALSSMVAWGKLLTGGKLKLNSVTLARMSPDNPQLFRDTFDAPVFFGSSSNSLFFNKQLLSLPFNQSNDLVKRHLKGVVENLFAQGQSEKSMSRVIEQCIRDDPAKFSHMSAMESRLGVSRQTIYRTLKNEGVSFRQLLQKERFKLACDYLQSKRMTISQVAEILGYSDESSFNKSFQKLSGGISPSKFGRERN